MLFKKSILSLLAAALFCASSLQAQLGDTLLIDAKKINTNILKPGVHRYLVYFKMGKDSNRVQTQFWTRTIARSSYQGMPAIAIQQSWEDKDSIMHTTASFCDAQTLQPLYHESWWKQRGRSSFDFVNKTATFNGMPLSDADTARQRKKMWEGFKAAWDKFVLNWHLDLEVFPTLPYKKGAIFSIPYYDPGFTAPAPVIYTVTGEADLPSYNNQSIPCWLLLHETKGNKEVFWISKKTKEVLQLVQEINGKIYRYKVKLSFSE
jgi:hypothetical protein